MIEKSEDGEWLRMLAKTLLAHPDRVGIDGEGCAKRLENIALHADELALMKKQEARDFGLEKKVDKRLCELVELWTELDDPWEDHNGVLAAVIWLTGRQIKSAGVVQSIGSLLPMLALGGGALDLGHKSVAEVLEKYGGKTDNERLRDRMKGGKKRKR